MKKTIAVVIALMTLTIVSPSIAQTQQAAKENIETLNAILWKSCQLEPTQGKVQQRYDGVILVELSPTLSTDQKSCATKVFSQLKGPVQYR
jgi:hypothetical protein